MRLKTFRGPDLATALAHARRELGADALVLATNELPGRMGLPVFEVTAGVDGPAPAAAAVQPRPAAQPHPALRAAVESLIRSGLTKDLAMRFARSASTELGDSADPGDLAASAVGAMSSLAGFRRLHGTRPLFVVGPPGAGKTTAVARLAARDKQHSLLAESDRCRVGAREQAEGFARLLDVPMRSVAGPADLVELLERNGSGRRVLVDTAGVGGNDSDRMARLVELRTVAKDADVAVLLPAGLHRDEARRVIERFSPINPTSVAFSKVDDGGRLGDLVSAVAPTRLPLSFVTNGHGVHDLEPLTPRGLAALLLRAGFEEQIA